MTKLTLSLLVVAACGSGKGGDPPAKPHTGAPLAFEVQKLTPGKMFDGKIAVRAYNFSDKPIAQYAVMMRFYDKSGARIVEDPKSGFDHESMSFGGKRYICDPKSWCEFTFDAGVPEGSVKATVLASRLSAVKSDGMTMEENDLFDLPGMDWPEATAVAKPVAP